VDPVPDAILTTPTFLAYHGTHAGGDGGNLSVLFIFLGVVGTAAWLIFSELRWVHTVTVAVAGWAAGLSVAFVL
jgi:hypothetical protein